MALIVSVNIGQVATRKNAAGKLGKTGIGKQPVSALVSVGKAGLEGDQSAYRSRELGDTAVHVFCKDSYGKLSQKAGVELPVPCFGENLTVEGLRESEVRIGDVYSAGDAQLCVNQPVVRCTWPGVVAGEPRLLKWILGLQLTGFYLHVIKEGHLQVGDELSLVERGPDPDMTIPALNEMLAGGTSDEEWVARVLANSHLAERWKASLRQARKS